MDDFSTLTVGEMSAYTVIKDLPHSSPKHAMIKLHFPMSNHSCHWFSANEYLIRSSNAMVGRIMTF